MRRVARRVEGHAILRCPVRTGRLRASIESDLDISLARIQVLVSADTPYAKFVHDGTRPHLIRPRRPGGVLRFTVGGDVVFTTLVRHPGTRPQPFLTDALHAEAVPLGFVITRT